MKNKTPQPKDNAFLGIDVEFLCQNVLKLFIHVYLKAWFIFFSLVSIISHMAPVKATASQALSKYTCLLHCLLQEEL